MKTISAAKSYSKVLFDLACNANKLDTINENIQTLGLLCDKMHKVFLTIDKQASISKKKEFVDTLVSYGKFHDITIKFLKLLKQENKLSILNDVSKSFMELHRKDKNVVVVKVKSVVDLDKKTQDNVEKFLNDILNKEVVIDNIIDQSIMGGIVIEIGSYIIDNSFINKIRRIKLEVDKI